ANQLAIKRQILGETLERTAKIKWQGEIHLHSSPPWGYRNRTRMKVTTEPFALGYYRHNSHDLLPVESCPISSPLINRAIAAIWEMGRSGGFTGYPLSEVEFFSDHADAKLLLELYAEKPMPEQDWQKLTESLRARMPNITSLSVLSRAKHTRPEMQCESTVKVDYSFQSGAFLYLAGAARYQVSPGSFFQTNRFLVERLVEIVCAEAKGKLALDLFAGVGLFSAPLAKAFDRVEAVEVAPSSFNDLRKNVPRNVRAHCMTTAEYLKTAPLPANLDFMVVDPPRAGLGAEVSRKLAALAPARVTYVSCDPATLARDLAVFQQSGYAIEQIHLLDLFPQTFHIETVVHLSRNRTG
ncbi:MAG TPA: hypothetical protein VFA71_07610, partial [Terriglobales bacterium]|nr:hypothetical protein [Terriglobales bacterium]